MGFSFQVHRMDEEGKFNRDAKHKEFKAISDIHFLLKEQEICLNRVKWP